MVIRELILQHLFTSLSGIEPPVYTNTISNVQRFKQSGNTVVETPAILISTESENKIPLDFQNLIACNLRVTIDLRVRQTDDTPIDQVLSSLLGDIEKAVMSDRTQGGNCIDTKILGNTTFNPAEGQPFSGLLIDVEFFYRHFEGNLEEGK